MTTEKDKEDAHEPIIKDFMYEAGRTHKPDRAIYERYKDQFPQFSQQLDDAWLILHGYEPSGYDSAKNEFEYQILDQLHGVTDYDHSH